MHNFFLILTGMAFGVILLIVCKLMFDYRQILTAKILSLLLLSAACYILKPLVNDISYVNFFLGIVSMTSPALFWMFASTLFQMNEKNQKLHLGHYLGLGVCIVLGVYQYYQVPTALNGSILHFVVTSTLTILGLFDVFRNWQSDLVECRRILRLGLSVTSGGFCCLLWLSNLFMATVNSLRF